MDLSVKENTISFCTACRNRLQHLKLTLPRNIEDSMDDPGVIFVILDYGSTDGLREWIEQNFCNHLESGKLEYYHFGHATFFHRTHSRNLAFKIARTEIVCNIDADNYIGNGFARFVAEQFSSKPNIFLTTIDFYRTQKKYYVPGDVLGRLCVKKTDFLAVGGFDERMADYGFEDYDLTNRLEMSGVERQFIKDSKYLQFIGHENEIRLPDRYKENSKMRIYIKYENPWKSSALYLFENFVCSWVTLINNARINAEDYKYSFKKREFWFENAFVNNKWHYGKWEKKGDWIYMAFNNTKLAICSTQDACLQENAEIKYYQVTNPILFNTLAKLHLVSKNRIILEDNLGNKVATVNGGTFGKGTVTKNFQTEMEII